MPYQVWAFEAKQSTGNAFKTVYQRRDRVLRRIVHEQVNVVVLATRFNKLGFEVSTDLLKDGSKPLDRIHVEDPMAILGDKDQVNVKLEHTMSTTSNVIYNSHSPRVRW